MFFRFALLEYFVSSFYYFFQRGGSIHSRVLSLGLGGYELLRYWFFDKCSFGKYVGDVFEA